MKPQKEILSPAEAMKILHLSRPFFSKLVHAGKIPFHPISPRKKIFLYSELLEWIKSMKPKTPPGNMDLPEEKKVDEDQTGD